MSIHTDHPFLEPEDARRPVRRLRGRLPSPVTVWAGATPDRRAGLTVSSTMVADGDPAKLLGLVDEESELRPLLAAAGGCAVSLLGPDDRQVADVFAGLAPSPGGAFRTGEWEDTEWGPVLAGRSFVGARLADPVRQVGWALLVELTIEHVELRAEGSLAHHRGRYLPLPG